MNAIDNDFVNDVIIMSLLKLLIELLNLIIIKIIIIAAHTFSCYKKKNIVAVASYRYPVDLESTQQLYLTNIVFQKRMRDVKPNSCYR